MTGLVEGEGPGLVLLHGVGLDHAMWRPLADRLACHRKVIAFDMPGHGGAADLTAPATLDQFNHRLWQEMDRLHLAQVDLCGFSMGAMIAQAAVHERPQAVRNLILMSGVHRRSDSERAGVRARLDQARQQGPASNIEGALQRWFTPAFHRARPDAIDAIRRQMQGNNPDEFLKAYELFAEADIDLADRASSIDHRTLVTTGELDTGSTPAMMTALASEMARAETHLLTGLAHMAPVEDPVAVAAVLDAFLAGAENNLS